MSDTIIRPGDLVFVTGVSGLIGSHVADHLLLWGINVRGAVRDEAEAAMMRDVFASRYPAALDPERPSPSTPGSFEPLIVPDMKLPHAFDQALTGCAGIAHVASDLSFNPDPEVVITGCVNAIRGLLNAAKAARTVRRVVYTSSSNAGTDPEFDRTPKVIDAETWNDGILEKAFAPMDSASDEAREERGYIVYAASKYACEKAAWKWMETKGVGGFVFNTVLPNYTTGPILQPLSVPGAGSTARWVHDAFHHPFEEKYVSRIRDQPPQWQVDVRDVAKLHLAALMERDVKEERLLAFANPFGYESFLREYRRLEPDRSFPEAEENEETPSTRPVTNRSVELLRRFGQQGGWTGFEESVKVTCLGEGN